jgi:MoaA/NifB/PqqE/SkfB family radical SAM enzyme
MPGITKDRIGVALDMHGCPNRCRHCYLGYGNNRKMSDDDLRWAVAQFRHYLAENDTGIESLSVSSYFREPDFSDDYRHLYELEVELRDGPPESYELLSIWRLARDKEYAAWAKSVGHDTCQVSLFGMENTTDWFYRRRGAFHDALTATERLLDIGMKPRWQLFLTKKLLPEIDDFLRLVERLRLRERVREIGGGFQLFMQLPGPEHEGRKIEYLRPTAEEASSLPDEILKASKKHLGRQVLWQTESKLYASITEDGADLPKNENILSEPESFWFFVMNNWDVYSNIGTLEPWWRLGNLKEDTVAIIMQRFEHDEIPGLDILYRYPPEKLADEYGDPEGRKIYSGKTDLLSLYHAKHCEKILKI